MDDDIAIKVDHVSKKYCKSLKSSMLYGVNDIVRNSLGFSSHSERLRNGEFWAVNDVSFELKKGETLGIIGHNGSGKTTLLKMLNGIFWPDRGKITIKGKVGALIEVGAGFHPLLTGRENIYVNGAILGMNKREIEERFDDIVAFADIGDFLDSPVKNYSSGMYVRLGFAVAVHSNPDILLIDEVLAVGDTNFQSKCYSKIANFIKDGVAIILVAHNMETIRHVCDRALLISKGRLQEIGESNKVVLNYLKLTQQEEIMKAKSEKEILNKKEQYYLNLRKGKINNVRFFDKNNYETNSFIIPEAMRIRIEYDVIEDIENPVFAVHLFSNNVLYASFISNQNDFSVNRISGNGVVELHIEQVHLPTGVYAVTAVLSRDVEFNHIDWKDKEYFVQINKKEDSLGLIALPHKWNLLKII